jgi:hypothetical protein
MSFMKSSLLHIRDIGHAFHEISNLKLPKNLKTMAQITRSQCDDKCVTIPPCDAT